MAITFKDAESAKPCPRFPTSRAARARGLSRCQHQDLPQTRRHGCLDASRFTKGPWPAAKFRASQNWPLKSHHKVCARWPFKPRLAASGLAASVTKMADSTSSSSIQGATAFALPKDDYLDEKHAPGSTNAAAGNPASPLPARPHQFDCHSPLPLACNSSPFRPRRSEPSGLRIEGGLKEQLAPQPSGCNLAKT